MQTFTLFKTRIDEFFKNWNEQQNQKWVYCRHLIRLNSSEETLKNTQRIQHADIQ